jgi:peptide/nickel transport system ATP-binding protein
VVLTGEIPDPSRIPDRLPVPPALPALADGSAERAGVAEACRTEPLEVCPGRETTAWPVTSTASCLSF